ncbi:MAG: hypothetical protein WB615_06495 [Candidatus Tumulicola sp.]
MEKYRTLDPTADLETVMAMLAAIVLNHAPGYRGKISLEFCDMPFPQDPRARFRGTAVVDPPIGPRSREPYDRLLTSSEIALEMDRALRAGWLDYDGDLVLSLGALPADEPFTAKRENGRLIVWAGVSSIQNRKPSPNEPWWMRATFSDGFSE